MEANPNTSTRSRRIQQAQADKGTVMACLTLDILNAIEASRDLDGIERPTTIENPPETDHPEAGSAFYLPEAFVRQAPVAVWKKGAAPAPTNAARWRQVRLAAQGDVQEGHQRRGEQSGGGRPKTSRLDVGEDSRTIRDVGNKVFECLDAFCRSHPEAAKAAEGYGTPDFHLEGVAEWRQALEKHFKLEDTKPALDLKGLLEYKTPEDDDSKSYKASVAAQEWAKLNNYKSFTDNQKDSDVEMERLVSLGYVKKLTTQEAERYFSHPVVSKLRHIVKEKPDGSKKRRVIVDALRSGANSQAVFLREMKRLEPDLRRWYFDNKWVKTRWSAEFAAADLVDAFTHYPVAEAELTQCVSPAGDGKHVYV
eukprot:s4095_g7.t1